MMIFSSSVLLFLLPIAIIGGALIMRRRTPAKPVPPTVYRLHPGVAHQAEWMAAPDTVERIAADYMTAVEWSAKALTAGYVHYLRELPDYYTGEGLVTQSRIVLTHVRRSGTRLIGILEADHAIEVRRFSGDGRTCDLFDRQSNQRMVTIDLWTKRRINVQSLGAALYVYPMQYDLTAQRWKIARRAQQIPLGASLTYQPTATVQLTDQLPVAVGHD